LIVFLTENTIGTLNYELNLENKSIQLLLYISVTLLLEKFR